jgi:thioredoxin 1
MAMIMPDNAHRVASLKLDQFEDVLAANEFLIINFSARWCRPCRVFNQAFAEAAGGNSDASFAVVDVEAEPDFGAAFGVGQVPMLAVVRGGALVFSHEGALSLEALDDVIRQVRALDVDELRRAVAESISTPT